MTLSATERTSLAVDLPGHPAPCLDARLRELHDLVDSGDFDLLSLDVFDTLVWRRVPQPADLFFLVADAVRASGGLLDSSSREGFVRERIRAEERARRRTPAGEITLADIYAEFPRGFLNGMSPAQVSALEFQAEQRMVVVAPAMRDLLSRARSRGLRTALVSDTYLRSGQIHALTGVDVDYTIVSCEHGRSKPGGLHQVLLGQSGVPAARILHVGDSRLADLDGPASLGLARFWFPRFPEAYEDMVGAELPSDLSQRAPYLVRDDAGLTALRGRVMFMAESEYERWGAGVVGPVISGFCDWVAERCGELGLTEALCLMREGRILKQVLDVQAPGLRTHEFFVSRYVVLKAAIFDGSEAELERFVLRPSRQPCSELLDQLGLEPADLPWVDAGASLTPEQTLALVRCIARDPSARGKVVRVSATARRNLLAHVEAVLGPGGQRRIAVVDLGYHGTIQGALQRIFDREGTGFSTHGLYLMTGDRVHIAQASGATVEGWLAGNGQPVAVAHTFVRSPEIVEQSLMADCGTTLGHDEQGDPILDEFRVPDEQRRQIAEVQRGILLWTREWARHRVTHEVTEPLSLRAFYRAICIRSVARPLDLELELFGRWQHDENFGSAAAHAMAEAPDLHEWERTHLSAHQLASLLPRQVYWPFGFAHGISRTMGEAVAGIFLRTVKPEAFDLAVPPRHLVFYCDSGRGFCAEEARVETYRLNNRGCLWHRIRLQVGGRTILRFGLTLGLAGERLQLTGVRVHRRPTGGDEQVDTYPHEVLEKSGYRLLHGDLYLVEDDPALIVIPAAGLYGFTGTVDVDLFFSIHG
jgi:FMN phosphatase YigB (HAD superfamily)